MSSSTYRYSAPIEYTALGNGCIEIDIQSYAALHGQFANQCKIVKELLKSALWFKNQGTTTTTTAADGFKFNLHQIKILGNVSWIKDRMHPLMF